LNLRRSRARATTSQSKLTDYQHFRCAPLM
jgi:hypothetical protein